MILTCHFLVGALIAAKIKIIPLALLLDFLSHYLLDFIPHIEYSVKNIKEKSWEKSLPDFLKVILDISSGILLIFILKNQPIIFLGAFFAVSSDGFSFLSLISSNHLIKVHQNFHRRIHFLENKKISPFWRIFSQISIILIVILLI